MKLIRLRTAASAAAAAAALAVSLAGISSAGASTGSPGGITTVATAQVAQVAPGFPASDCNAVLAKAIAATTAATNAAKIKAAKANYTADAVKARAAYYQGHRLNTAASKTLAQWYTIAAQRHIVAQVNGWDPNYKFNIDVRRTIHVLPGGTINAAGNRVTFRTQEWWFVGTEGGPVRTRDGVITTQEHGFVHTVIMMKFAHGWAVIYMTWPLH